MSSQTEAAGLRARQTESDQSASDSYFQVTTDELPEKDRLAIHHKVTGHNLLDLHVSPHGDDPYRVKATINRYRDSVVSLIATTAAQYEADQQSIDARCENILIFTAQQGRAIGTQFGREGLINPGEGFAILNSELATVNAFEQGRYLSVCVPRAVLAPMIPDIDSRLMQPQALDPAALKLLMGYAELLRTQSEPFSPQMQRSISTHLADLAATALGASGDAAAFAADRGIRHARLEAIKNHVAAHFSKADLSADQVAKRLGITPRYIRKLLESAGTTFSDLVLQSRLEHAHRLLRDPRMRKRPISNIAYDVGFGDLSYFNRTFRRQFGMKPSDARFPADD